MNLTQFIKRVDTVITNLPQKKLAEFIHNMARGLSENQREDFLNKLYDMAGEVSVESDKQLIEKYNTKEIQKELCQIQAELLRIERGELCLIGNLNEEYDDWYHDSADEFIFEDSKNIIEIIEKACDIIHQCVDCELYEECYEFADMLIALEIMVEGDYSDYGGTNLSLKELGEYELSSFSHRQLTLDALCVAYWSNSLEERPDALYRIICNSGCRDITLEALMQEGKKELEQLPGFLKLWVEYLGTCSGQDAERLLSEAVALQNDSELSLEAARKFSGQHPGLYEQILKQNLMSGKDDELFDVGQEALRTIQPQYIVRSRVALMTAVYALRLKKQNEAELCWLEAFRSDTRQVHYLRMVVESLDFSGYREETRLIYRNCFEQAKKEKNHQYQVGELRENRIDKQTYFMLAFFGGEFRHVIEDGMNEKAPLGWSFTFMKVGIGLFFMYLYQGDDLPVGCKTMCGWACESISFTFEEYSQGLGQPVHIENTSLFWECFRKWKMMNSMSVTEEQWILEKLEEWIRIRVDGIMQANHRKYYGECAAFIAALGEVTESRGEMNGKANLMEDYRAAYSRRTAFHKELRAFGMNDRRI